MSKRYPFRILRVSLCNVLEIQLFMKRLRVASNTEKTALRQIDANFMSDKEDGEGSQEGLWVVRSPPWCSPSGEN